MKIEPNQEKLIILTNYEIITTISLLRKTIPDHDDQQTVINVIEKLQKIVRS